MKGLPDSKVYEQGLQYWSYFISLNKVLDYLARNVPQNGTLIDLMCGPGYLLGKIAEKRPDLKVRGMDIDNRYIIHAKSKYPHIDFKLGNVLTWTPDEQYDAVICTGPLHHIAYEQQEEAVKKWLRWLSLRDLF